MYGCGGSLFPSRFQSFARRLAETVVSPLARAGLTPNMVTVGGLVSNMVVARVIAAGHLTVGGLLLLVAGAIDMLDGALARRTHALTPFGAFLDSTLDRYSEAIVLIGLVYVETELHNTLNVSLAVAALTGSFLISYARARAEGLGFDCKVGLLPRPERILILAIGLIFPVLTPVLILLVILTNLTAAQRIFTVWRAARVRS
jgi:CDP-diacylglycerol--glycerol-3-phosphate 3-phosphatidyltransferase